MVCIAWLERAFSRFVYGGRIMEGTGSFTKYEGKRQNIVQVRIYKVCDLAADESIFF